MGIPSALAQRSAAARAAETGSSIDAILSAWTGGAPVAATAPAPAAESEAPAEPAPAATPAQAAEPAPVAAIEAPRAAPVTPEIFYEEEPEEPLEPAPLGRRLGIASRVGVWSRSLVINCA